MLLARVRLLLIVFASVGFYAGVPVKNAAPQQPKLRGRTDVVSVNVSVRQSRQPVQDLVAGEFALTDNGVEQTVDALSLTRVPIDLTLVLAGDESTSRDGYFRAMTGAASVRRSLSPQDRLRTVRVEDEITGRLLGNDESLWARAVDRVNQGVSVSIEDGLFYAMAWPVEAERRHLVVAFTGGLDRYSVLESEMLPRLAAHSDAVLHVVIRNVDYSSALLRKEWEVSQGILSDTARRTGGTVRGGTDALNDIGAIIEDYRTSYVLQYTPIGIPSPGWHELHVSVRRPGRFDVRARQGYEIRRK